MKIATGGSAFSNKIKTIDITVSKLFRLLATPKIRRKKDGPYFVFAEFNSKGIRRKENVKLYHGATIDLDDTPLSLDDIQKTFKEYKFCIYTTHNHQDYDTEKEKVCGDRYRLVIPYANPLSVDDHKLTMFYIMNELGIGNIDTSTDAISRPMYLPSRRPPNDNQTGHFKFIKHQSGDLFHLELNADIKFELSELKDQLEQDKPKVDINEKIIEGQGRNDAAASLFGKFIAHGMAVDEAYQMISAWNQNNCIPPLKDKELKTITASIADGHSRRGNEWGYDEMLRQIKETTNPQKDYDPLARMIGTAKKLKGSQREILSRELAKRLTMPISFVKEDVKRAQMIDDEIQDEEIKEKDQFTAKSLRREFRNFCFINTSDRVYNFNKQTTLKPEGFNRAHSSTVEKGSLLNLLLKHKCIKQADVMEFHPGEGNIFHNGPLTCANSYTPAEVFPLPGSVRPMLRHFKKLIDNEQDRELLLDFIAFLFQNPGEKVMWMPVIKGGHGVGKSIIINFIITPLLGIKNIKHVQTKKIKADFNAWQLDTQLIAFHELKTEGGTRADRLAMTEALKELITEPFILASYKGVDDYQVPNRTNIIGLTNHEDAILIAATERRFYMIRSDMIKQARSYYRSLRKWFASHKEEMLYYFENRKISENFDPGEAPANLYTTEVKDQSYLWPSSILVEGKDQVFYTEGVTTWDNIARYVYSQSVGKDLQRAETAMKASSSEGHRLMSAIKDLGFRRLSKPDGQPMRYRIDGSLQTVYLSPGSTILSSEDKRIKRIITKQQNMYEFNEE